MDAIRRALFEKPLYLYILLGIAEAVIGYLYLNRRERRFRTALVVPVLLAGCVFLVERLVVTDREQIIAASEAIARDLEAGRIDALERRLDERFAGFYRDKEFAIAQARRAMDRYQLKVVQLRNFEVTVHDGTATMLVTTIVEAGRGNAAGRRVPLNWTIRWAEAPGAEDDPWRIIAAEPAGWTPP
jgi:hypothetical protein